MKWDEIRHQFPQKWVLIEALSAREEGEKRFPEDLTVIDMFDDSIIAFGAYKRVHHQSPKREFYVAHTTKPTIEIIERKWLGIRPA